MDIQDMLFRGIKMAERLAPTESGSTKRHLATTYVLGVVESVDGMLPSVGAFMDLPVVDGLQHKLVEAAVEWGFAFLTLNGQRIIDQLDGDDEEMVSEIE